MKFDNILKNIKPMTSVKATKENTTIKDPEKYPKKIIPTDPGISDRSVSGFASSINVLTGKEKMGQNNKDIY